MGHNNKKLKKSIFVFIEIVILISSCINCSKFKPINSPEKNDPQNTQSFRKQDPFCLFEASPIVQDDERTRREIPFIQDLGVKYVIHGGPIHEKEDAESGFASAKHIFDFFKDSGFSIVPYGSQYIVDRPVKEFSETLIAAIATFPQIHEWMFSSEVDAWRGPDAYSRDEDELMVREQHLRYKLLARKWALYNRIAFKIVKDRKPNDRVASSGTIGDFSSYLYMGEQYIDPTKKTKNEMKRDGYYVYFMKALQEFEKIEKNPSLYDWGKNELGLSSEEFNIAFSPDSYSQYFDIHQYSDFDEDASDYHTGTNNLVNSMQKLFQDFGYNKVDLWITQGATHTGALKQNGDTSYHDYQTERVQARYVVKKYITSIVAGIEKICWIGPFEQTWGDLGTELGGEPNYEHAISQDGLIYDGNGIYDSGDIFDPEKRDKIKKLSYHTFKKMIQIMENSDWNNIQIIQENNGIYVYRFTKEGKSIWVAWSDNSEQKQITISGINSNKVKIIKAVPKFEMGSEVTDYNTAFETATTDVNNDKITFSLDEDPVYIKEQ